jgi:hypothetical protein
MIRSDPPMRAWTRLSAEVLSRSADDAENEI